MLSYFNIYTQITRIFTIFYKVFYELFRGIIEQRNKNVQNIAIGRKQKKNTYFCHIFSVIEHKTAPNMTFNG